MDCLSLLKKYFPDPEALAILVGHSEAVAKKALLIAQRLNEPGIDLDFIYEAALLHDIGICRTHAPKIGCNGAAPYICHGILGRELLENEGLPVHALVCERHIGVGLSVADILTQELPLPRRDMLPLSREERIICFADLFFSKTPGKLTQEKTPEEVRRSLTLFGEEKASLFDSWLSELSSHP